MLECVVKIIKHFLDMKGLATINREPRLTSAWYIISQSILFIHPDGQFLELLSGI